MLDWFQSTPPAREATAFQIHIHLHSKFQSTPPAREATYFRRAESSGSGFNPRPPRGRRRKVPMSSPVVYLFQSTPPAREATSVNPNWSDSGRFQSTPPAREATVYPDDKRNQVYVSIHAPREGGDLHICNSLFECNVSIHAPREGGDLLCIPVLSQNTCFNPRPPRGRRQSYRFCKDPEAWFQSTPPAREATYRIILLIVFLLVSIHAPREGGDPLICSF